MPALERFVRLIKLASDNVGNVSAADSERKFDRMLRVTSNYGDVVMAMSHC